MTRMTPEHREMPAPGRVRPLDPETTIELLQRYRKGDSQALADLAARCLPPLRRWARGRVPAFARGVMDTQDVVQDTVLGVLRHIDVIDVRNQGALQAYLRQAIVNRIRDIVRQHQRRPAHTGLPDQLRNDETSPLDRLLGAEKVARYEAAIQRLRAADRDVLIGRFELQYSYEELTVALDKPTVTATRVAVTRAIQRLIAEMRHVGSTPA